MSSITPKPGMKVEISMQGIEKSRLDAIESAEAQRKADEAERDAAEVMRKDDEAGRITAEQDRALEEYARELAENGRMLAEESRVKAEDQRAADEQNRVDAEDGRGVAEANRVNAEQQRVAAEKLRANAEDARATAEGARANAEALRQHTFEANEANRQAAFDSAETQRASEWSEIESDVESSVGSAVAAASAATDAANTATENANAAAEKSVRYDVVQALGDAQKAQARGNIDAADISDINRLKDDLTALQTAAERKYAVNTVMDSVATPHTQYFLGVQNSVEIVLPDTADVGQIISVSWYNGDTAATLSITGTMLDFDFTPSENSRSEINALWDGTYWSVLGNEMAVV